MKSINYIVKSALLSVLLVFVSCGDFISVNPPETELIKKTVFDNDATATSAINGVYSNMMESLTGLFNGGATLYPALSADEIVTLESNVFPNPEFLNNSLLPRNSQLLQDLWTRGYSTVYSANSILEGVTNNSSLTKKVQEQLVGEAKFVRAFSYLYLLNMFGSIAYTETTDYRINSALERSPASEVYEQIIADLKDSENVLTGEYPTGERLRPNKAAVMALLARVYLYTEDWTNAEEYSSKVISNADYFLVPNVSDVFQPNSEEVIWQLRPVIPQYNTGVGEFFARSSGSAPYGRLSDQMINAFEDDDLRKSIWLNSFTASVGGVAYVPFKYKTRFSDPPVEYNVVLRLAEQYLIRAEARAKNDDLVGALDDLNEIRFRAGLANLPTDLTKDEILSAVEQERRVELFVEWGHRWFDLKRTGKAAAVLGQIKSDWQDTDIFYPIPQIEIDRNSKLLPQNLGYN